MADRRITRTLARISATLAGLSLFIAVLGKTSPDQTIDALTTVLGVTDGVAWWMVLSLVAVELMLGAVLMAGVWLCSMCLRVHHGRSDRNLR